MFFSSRKFKQLGIGWNERRLDDRDFHQLCRKFKIITEEIPLTVSGFYFCMRGRHFIVIDSKLPPRKKLFVMFHELAHYLMHAPNHNETASYHGVGRPNRKEREADMFALVALIPKHLLELRSPDELIRDESITPDDLAARYALFETHGL